MNDEEFLPTRRSLISRLKNQDDQESWKEFFETYGRLIHRMALKAGLTDAEAQDVMQETVIIAARKLPGFKYDPAIGSFKSWLLLITRRRIEKQLKKRIPVRAGEASGRSTAGEPPPRRSDDTQRTATIERVPAPKSFDLESVWNAEWEKNLWDAALAQVKARVKPKQFQMFDFYVRKEWPVKDVARALNVSVAQVYVNKHRVTALLKKVTKQLKERFAG
jgi:RNA polymerase sigma factor (sigma-70 family)